MKKQSNDFSLLVDRISLLPVPIIHHILSLLSTKEATQTTILSKSWRSMWTSFMFFDFDEQCFMKDFTDLTVQSPYIPSIPKRMEFFNYVNDSLLRREDYSMQKFRLYTSICNMELASNVYRWVKMAIERDVKELDLGNLKCIEHQRQDLLHLLQHHSSSGENVYDSLWPVIFGAKSITVLRLVGFNLNFFGTINLSSLERLFLADVRIDDYMIQYIISSCPLIKELSIKDCYGLKVIQIFSSKIETLELKWCCGLEMVEIEELESQYFLYAGLSTHCKSNVATCRYLKTLIFGGMDITGKWFEDLISSLLFLENVILDHCDMMNWVKISHKELKSLHLLDCPGLEAADIDTPNVVSFVYSGEVIFLRFMFPLGKVDAKVTLNPVALGIERDFTEWSEHSLDWVDHYNALLKLKNFLALFDHCKVFMLDCYDKEWSFLEDPISCYMEH